MTEDTTKLPNWTVIYNILSKDSCWIGKGWEFFTNKEYAQTRYKELKKTLRMVPTLRPYHHEIDYQQLGECHK